MIGDPLQELAASWAPFESGLAWAAWCEQDRASEIGEMLADVRTQDLNAAIFEGQHCVDPPAEIVELAPPEKRLDRSAA